MTAVRVSGCIITQDAPELLEQCLTDMEFADEIIVVDGGPGEAVRSVASGCPKAVYIAHPWPGNYSTQRNVYLQAARGDWIFSMDTDERLPHGFGENLDEWLRRQDVDGFCFPRLWRTGGNQFVLSPWHYPDFNLRLFRNRPGLIYRDGPENAVHHMMDGLSSRIAFLQSPVILHDCLIHDDRRAREEKIRHYDSISSNQSGTRYSAFYLFEDHPHDICEVSQRPEIASLSWIGPLKPYLSA